MGRGLLGWILNTDISTSGWSKKEQEGVVMTNNWQWTESRKTGRCWISLSSWAWHTTCHPRSWEANDGKHRVWGCLATREDLVSKTKMISICLPVRNPRLTDDQNRPSKMLSTSPLPVCADLSCFPVTCEVSFFKKKLKHKMKGF